jgi:hypothetical protein
VTALDRDGRVSVDIWTLPLDKFECSTLLRWAALAVGLQLRDVPTECGMQSRTLIKRRPR